MHSAGFIFSCLFGEAGGGYSYMSKRQRSGEDLLVGVDKFEEKDR